MHVLDFLMWIVISVIIWWLMGKLTNDEYTTELGSLFGFTVILIFTIVYIILFGVYPDWNWVDIFNSIKIEQPILIKW